MLTAGGHAVHRVNRRPPLEESDRPRADSVPTIERYHDAAMAVHRTAAVPKGDTYIVVCSCGYAILSPPGSAARAGLVAKSHVLDMADRLYEKLEGRAPNPLGDDSWQS